MTGLPGVPDVIGRIDNVLLRINKLRTKIGFMLDHDDTKQLVDDAAAALIYARTHLEHGEKPKAINAEYRSGLRRAIAILQKELGE